MNDYINAAFTRQNEKTNLEINNLNVDCITSKNNKFELDSEGNLTVKSITAEEGLPSSSSVNVLDNIYPVGSIYMSVLSTNPETFFGGSWEQIQDRFLLGCGVTYTNGASGGSAIHTLNVDEIPAHTHNIQSSGGHIHLAYFKEHRVPTQYYSGTNDYARKADASYDTAGQLTISNGEHTHIPDNVGGGLPHNNMPPYLAVYIWKRIA